MTRKVRPSKTQAERAVSSLVQPVTRTDRSSRRREPSCALDCRPLQDRFPRAQRQRPGELRSRTNGVF
ncbi:hypothetical protein MRX96_021181 [Rhipicephalus microplus]